MTLLATTLADGLKNLEPTDSEPTAISRFADAWAGYFGAATVGPVAVADGTLAGAKSAMQSALVGLSTQDNGAAALQAGIVAWWGAVTASAAVIWAGASPPVLSATPPPGLSGIASALATVFASNTAGQLALADAAQTIANVLHPLQLGGIAAVGPPPGSVPIL